MILLLLHSSKCKALLGVKTSAQGAAALNEFYNVFIASTAKDGAETGDTE